MDYDDKTRKIYLQLNPLAAATCNGIFTGEMAVQEEIGKAAQEIVRAISEMVTEKMGHLASDKNVALVTRKMILDLNSDGPK